MGLREALTISEVSELIEVPVPTIRSWERRYQLRIASRTPGGHRRYEAPAVATLRAVRDAIAMGMSPRGAADRAVALHAGDDGGELVSAIADAAVRWDVESVRSRLDAAAGAVGVDEAIARVAFGALREIGSRWRVGECGVGQEHAATGEIRFWLQRQRSLAPRPFRARPIVLACAPACEHSVPVEAFEVLLARRGWETRNLGARTPPESLAASVEALKPAAIVLACQQRTTVQGAAEQAEAAGAASRAPVLYAGGAFTAAPARRRMQGTYVGEDVLAAVDIVETEITGSRRH